MHKNYIVVVKNTCTVRARYVHHKRCVSWIAQRASAYMADEYEILTTEQYLNRAQETVEVVALLSGEKVSIQRCHVGTSCDPSRESYYTL